MDDWKDILDEDEARLSEEELLMYIDNKTSDKDKRSIEEIAGDPFEAEALEGLQQMKNTKEVKGHTEQLKRELRQQLQKRKNKKAKQKISDLNYIIFAIILLLFICVVGYLVIKMSTTENRLPNHGKTGTENRR